MEFYQGLNCLCFGKNQLLMKNSLKFLVIFLIMYEALGAQNASGTIVNYNADPVVSISGIEVYLDSTLKDTTDEQGTFGFPTTIVRDDNPLIPKEFKLNLFPNPFNPSTILEYTLPCRGDVSIIGYNALGQKMYSEEMENQMTGTYKLMFDANKYNIASQVLFFQVIVDPTDKSKAPIVDIIKGVYIK